MVVTEHSYYRGMDQPSMSKPDFQAYRAAFAESMELDPLPTYSAAQAKGLLRESLGLSIDHLDKLFKHFRTVEGDKLQTVGEGKAKKFVLQPDDVHLFFAYGSIYKTRASRPQYEPFATVNFQGISEEAHELLRPEEGVEAQSAPTQRVITTQLDQETDISAIEILRNDIETERLETISLARVLTEEALVDDTHADELGESMRQKRGQLTPITVRARLHTDGDVVYDVIDGFHRTEGKKRNGATEINATVVYGCSDEEMYDLRILAASSVRSVQFARVAQWITKSYATTPWAQKGISVLTAFKSTIADSKSSQGGLINPDEVTELKDWIREKCAKWGRPVGTVRNELLLVNQSDPSLVRDVRNVRTIKESLTAITQRKLASVVKEFPGQENFAAQRAILRYAVEHALEGERVEQIAALLQGVINSRMTEQTIKNLVAKADALLPKTETADSHAGSPGTIFVAEEAPSVEDMYDTISDLDEISELDELVVLDDRRKSSTRVKSSSAPQTSKLSKGAYGHGDHSDEQALRTRIEDLKAAIENATSSDEQLVSETWWRTAPYLTPNERICIERGLFKHEDLSTISSDIKVPVAQIYGLMKSAIVKRNILEGKEL